MGTQKPSPLPLTGDTARQAVASLRGYAYQIWRAVEAWVSIHVLAGKHSGVLINEWKARADGLSNPSFAKEVIRQVEGAIKLHLSRARDLMRDSSTAGLPKVGAALAVLSEPARSPVDTAYAQVGIIYWLKGTDAKLVLEEALGAFSAAFSGAWQAHLQSPALLLNPRLTVPELERVINDPEDGARKLRELIEAACAATGLRVPAEMTQWLRGIEAVESRRKPGRKSGTDQGVMA